MTARTRTDVLLLAGFCTFLFFYGLGAFGLIGADEPRYAQVAREMLDRKDWITPTLGGSPWLEKPPLYYWQAMLSYSVLGVTDVAARIPVSCGRHSVSRRDLSLLPQVPSRSASRRGADRRVLRWSHWIRSRGLDGYRTHRRIRCRNARVVGLAGIGPAHLPGGILRFHGVRDARQRTSGSILGSSHHRAVCPRDARIQIDLANVLVAWHPSVLRSWRCPGTLL